MVYTTWGQGFKEANSSTTASLKLETILPHTLPNLSQRIFPSYITSATLWSNLLASGLLPSSTGIQQFGSDTPATKQEAIKKWRMCLERADLVKKKVAAMGGQVGKPMARSVVVTRKEMNANTNGDPTERATQTRKKRDEAEQISILRRSSTLRRNQPSNRLTSLHDDNSAKTLHLPLWHDADATFLAPLTVAQVEQMVIQPDLSPDQRALHATWGNIYNPANPFVEFASCLPQSQPQGQLTSAGSIKVEQGIGANCSVVAGLNALVAHNARWGTALGMRNFVPIRIREKGDIGDEVLRVRYWRVKVFVNGAWRSMVIDSRLPVSSTTTQSLHCVLTPFEADSPHVASSTWTSPLLWIPLLEKAYMTIIGSYAFPGSTPATDIHTLTSWIPERIFSSGSQGFPRERTWSRITDGWKHGTLMITLGTGALVGRNGVSDARLVPLHAYAVVDVADDNSRGIQGGARRLKVMNPWKRGRTRMDDGRAWTRDLLESLVEEAEDEEADEPSDIWWMTWDEVCNTFDTVNLNWDTRMFEYSETVHAAYTGEDDNQPISVTVAAPSSGSDVWILLQRHMTTFAAIGEIGAVDTDPSQQNRAIKMGLRMLEDSSLGSGSLDVALGNEGALEYTTSTWILLQHNCLMDKANLLIRPTFEFGENNRAQDVTFTVAVFSDANIHLEQSRTAYPYEQTISVDFAGRTAGGHSGLPTYMYNPQYRIEIKQNSSATGRASSASIKCHLKGDDKTSYNLKLLWGKGRRVTELESQDVVADSGEYRYGRASILKDDLTGKYSLIASTFEPGRLSQASLSIESTLPLEISPIPQEGAGMFSRTTKGQWHGSTAAGRPSLGSYESNPRFELLIPDPAAIFCRLQLASPSSTSIPISIAIFKRGPAGSLKDQVATSGPYADATSGVVTPETHLDAGLYVIVPSTYAANVEESFTINVYATRKIELAQM